MINTELEGIDLKINVIVVSSLTTKAILGFNFLMKMEAESSQGKTN